MAHYSSRGRHFLIIIFVALAARLALFLLFYGIQGRTVDIVGGGDAAAYEAMANYVYRIGDLGHTLFLPRPFLFPALAGTLYHLVGVQPFVILAIHILLNVVTCLIVYRIAETIGQTPRTALYAGLLAALYPSMIVSSVTFMVEPLFLFFFALALLWFARYLKTARWRDLLSATAILVCATLTRLITLLLPLFWIPLLLRRGKSWKQQIAAFLLIAILPGAILTVRNWYYSGISTFSTESAWILLFMRAVSSERRATGAEPAVLYAKYIQDIETRLGNTPPPIESIPPQAIWQYFQPTARQQAVISQLAYEKNLAYPGWYILNSFYGLHRILSNVEEIPLPSLLTIPLQYLFALLAAYGAWRYWRDDRRWLWLLGAPVILSIGLTVALETAVLSTRHGLANALPMFILAAYGLAALEQRFRAKKTAPVAVSQSE